ncbi:MAG: HAMP domain-containing protein [Deltaproteobacteria bacterium]|nr:HAMP domain-containing protein [Deltaproteobacteria bacterium]
MKRRPLSLRAKLLVWYLGLLIALLTAFAVTLFLFFDRGLLRQVDASLKTASVGLARIYASQAERSIYGRQSMFGWVFGRQVIDRYVDILDTPAVSGQHGRLRREIVPLTDLAKANARRGIATYETFRDLDEWPVRVITMPIILNGQVTNAVVQVAASLGYVEDTLDRLITVMAIVFGISLLVATFAGTIFVEQALRPFGRIVRTVRGINARNLKERLNEPLADDELGRLARTFNTMLDSLETSFEQIRKFTADASHELKTPLTVLRGQIELGLSQERSPEDYQEILASALEEIGRLSKITTNLLMLSKADAGQVPLNYETVDLRELVHEVAEGLEILAGEKQIRLEWPREEEPVLIEGDRTRLSQLVSNLIDNAIHYTEPGGAITVRIGQANAFFVFMEVKDTGIGIAPADLGKIFDRFYRADKARTRREGGSGLGLSIVRWITEAHGGRIEVESEPGRGSSFMVFLPFRKPVPGGSPPLPGTMT